jgi:hypothetical protein
MNWHFPLAENEKSLYLLFSFLISKRRRRNLLCTSGFVISFKVSCVCVGASPTTGDEMRVLSLGFVVVLWFGFFVFFFFALWRTSHGPLFLCVAPVASLFLSVDKRS